MTRGRQRQKLRQQAAKLQAQQPATPEVTGVRGGALSEPFLEDRHSLHKDIRLAGRMARQRWKSLPEKRDEVSDRLFGIVAKRTVTYWDAKHGEPVEVDGPADEHAIAAARVIAVMEGQNQTDERDIAGYGDGVTVNVGINNVQRALADDPDYLEFLQRRLLENDGRDAVNVGSNGHS